MKHLSHVVCATDFSPTAERALAVALKLASGIGAKITVLHVDDSLWMTMGHLAPLPDLKKEGRELIEKNLRELQDRHDLATARIEVLEGKAHEAISDWMSTSGADLLVFGSHGASGWHGRHLGAVAEKLLHRVDASTLVVPPAPAGSEPPPPRFDRVLLGIDLGATGEAVVERAVELARSFRSKLVVLHVAAPVDALFPGSGGFWSGEERADLEARLEERRSQEMDRLLPSSLRAELGVEILIREGVAYETLAAVARERDVDLAVLGKGAGEGFVGTTAHRVVRLGVRPVLLVPAP